MKNSLPRLNAKQPAPIMQLLCDRAFDVIVHYTEDLTVHDRKALKCSVKPKQTWLWIVHKCGTHLARFDQDLHAGLKDSWLECLIRGGLRGSWPNAKIYLFTVSHYDAENEAFGFISEPLTFEYLTQQLPRPKPKVVLPGEAQQVYSPSFALAGLS